MDIAHRGLDVGSESYRPAKREVVPVTTGQRRFLGVSYGAAAIMLVPWIVLLATSQRRTAVAHRLIYVVPISVAAVIAGMGCVVVALRKHSELAIICVTFTVTSALVISWFHLVTGSAAIGTTDLLLPVAVLLPVSALTIGLSFLTAPGGFRISSKMGCEVLYALLAVALCLVAVRLTQVTPTIHAAFHLRLVWAGLDVFETIALASTAHALLVNSSRTPIAAIATSTLLLWDAWFNIAPTAGAAQSDAVAMALVEIPLSAVSAWVAIRYITGIAVINSRWIGIEVLLEKILACYKANGPQRVVDRDAGGTPHNAFEERLASRDSAHHGRRRVCRHTPRPRTLAGETRRRNG